MVGNLYFVHIFSMLIALFQTIFWIFGIIGFMETFLETYFIWVGSNLFYLVWNVPGFWKNYGTRMEVIGLGFS